MGEGLQPTPLCSGSPPLVERLKAMDAAEVLSGPAANPCNGYAFRVLRRTGVSPVRVHAARRRA